MYRFSFTWTGKNNYVHSLKSDCSSAFSWHLAIYQEEAENWSRRETIERFEIMVGMNEEVFQQLAKVVGADRKKILTSRLG